jgi:type II secretory pathway pseudopilin PulG
MMNPRFRSRCGVLGTIVAASLLIAAASAALPATAGAQESGDAADPATALADTLVAACRANEADFASHLTTANAAAFRALPATQRSELMKRLSLSDDPGKPLLSADAEKHIVLRCRAENNTVEYRFGTTRVQENLAFIPVAVVNSQQADFGMVREGGSWRLLSLGLVLFDVPQLAKQWAAADLATQEDTAIADLRALAEAIQTYRRAFGKLPESLEQLGPAPKDQISPEQAALVPADMAAGKHDGYIFRYRISPDPNGNDNNFELAATPEAYPKPGRRSFFLDTAGKVHGDDKHGKVATVDDPLIASEKAAEEK